MAIECRLSGINGLQCVRLGSQCLMERIIERNGIEAEGKVRQRISDYLKDNPGCIKSESLIVEPQTNQSSQS